MCGIAGYLNFSTGKMASSQIIDRMAGRLEHRGPDDFRQIIRQEFGLGFRRLAFVDLDAGGQPFVNEDETVILACNGEIYNHEELRSTELKRGHTFRSRSDCEVALHLYEEYGLSFFEKLNGQFSVAIYDTVRRRLVLARDHFGISPLYYAVTRNEIVFGSEIKAILAHPEIQAEANLKGLDQLMCFPGLVSPTTMFKGIFALPPGSILVHENGRYKVTKFWELDYPTEEWDYSYSLDEYKEGLQAVLVSAVKRRLQADVPVGLYISGGLDSSLVAALARHTLPDADLHSFSVTFNDRSVSEQKYQRMIVAKIGTLHREVEFGAYGDYSLFSKMIYHAECPVKESYNTCVMQLAAATRESGIKAVLGGEGADELFAGYPGYRFDAFTSAATSAGSLAEEQARLRLWGDPKFGYEKSYSVFSAYRQRFYSAAAWDEIKFDNALTESIFSGDGLKGRHKVHQRSLLDCRLRLSDHLMSDHGDRMLMAHGVEGRYPFLDRDVVKFAQLLPPQLKLNGFQEKFILKEIADGIVPKSILKREKFGFFASSIPVMLQMGVEWVHDLLSYDYIKRLGYFSADVVESLKKQHCDSDSKLDPRSEDDFLMIVLSFNILLSQFFDSSSKTGSEMTTSKSRECETGKYARLLEV